MLIEVFTHHGFGLLMLAIGLVVVTATIHAIGFSSLLRIMVRANILNASGFRRTTLSLIAMTCWLMMVHLLEISAWGLFYFWQGCLPDIESAFYFSGTTYTTLGYGDLILPSEWRMLAPFEALTGIMMCGLSTGFFFAVVSRWIINWVQKKTT